MRHIDAKIAVPNEVSPETDGRRLAQYILTAGVSSDLEIDVSGLGPTSITPTFVNALLQALDEAGHTPTVAQTWQWQARFPAEADRLRGFVDLYCEDFTQ